MKKVIECVPNISEGKDTDKIKTIAGVIERPGARVGVLGRSIFSNYELGRSPQTVNQGASGTAVTAVPNVGYHFVSWSDRNLTAVRTDSNVMADITVTATFTTAIDAYTITVVSGPNGRILPGSDPNPHHTTRVFNIHPDAGYLIDSVILDGVPLVDAVNKHSYVVTLKNVEGPHTLAATFRPRP